MPVELVTGNHAAGYALSIWLHMWLNSAYALIKP